MLKAILVTNTTNDYYLDSLKELENLALNLGIEKIDELIWNNKTINNNTFIGSGKILELKRAAEILSADIVIFDTVLTPNQFKHLDEILDIQIMDRSFVILQIFSLHARSEESILEVSLAEKEYLLPRLLGIRSNMSRQGGSSYNAKGPGETKLELDRRVLERDILNIKRKLSIIENKKDRNRDKRLNNNSFTVSLVGYTNAGKSSLMNSFIKVLESNNEEVLSENKLFATLETKIKRLKKKNDKPFLLVDTVGFISNLPTELIHSFNSTLDEIAASDLIILVIDGTSNNNMLELNTIYNILENIGANDIERITVVTKSDLTAYASDYDYISVSNNTLEGIDVLIETIYHYIHKNDSIFDLIIEYNKGNILNYIINNYKIIKLENTDIGTKVKLLISKEEHDTLLSYLHDSTYNI
ncbi:MAG: GTPase HflX [Acholeplasmatales bacterium]|jgi:GTP-binding protein HflX|nr:GTPase HflX [Acholeplasmatales bacterium]